MTLAIGIGFASVLSIVKIITQINILYFLAPLYAISLIMMKFTPPLFVGLAFDSGGVSGGALTSAFLTPLTLGIAQAVAHNAGTKAQSILVNGFGIIAFISVTPLIAVQALGIAYDWKLKRTESLKAEEELAALSELSSYGKEYMASADIITETIIDVDSDNNGDSDSNNSSSDNDNDGAREVPCEANENGDIKNINTM